MNKAKEYYDKLSKWITFQERECIKTMNHKTLEDVKELFEKMIPKITDKEYRGKGFKDYGIDCKLGREMFLTELEKRKL